MWSRRPRVRVPSLTPRKVPAIGRLSPITGLSGPRATGTDTGTDARASITGSGAGEGGDEPPIRFVGDELDLYAEYHFELVQKIVRDVQYVSRENAEDACAHAWLKFLQRQPDRDGDRWKGWLYVTAKREAWKLNALEFKEREDRPAPVLRTSSSRSTRAIGLSERVEFQAALQELKKLPPLLQEVVVVRSQVWRQADVAEAMGLSRQRVAELLVKAALRVSQLNEERHEDERPVASPRAARLRELEDEPPVFGVREAFEVADLCAQADCGQGVDAAHAAQARDRGRPRRGGQQRGDFALEGVAAVHERVDRALGVEHRRLRGRPVECDRGQPVAVALGPGGPSSKRMP